MPIPVLTVVELSDRLTAQQEIGTFKSKVGSTEVWEKGYLFDDTTNTSAVSGRIE